MPSLPWFQNPLYKEKHDNNEAINHKNQTNKDKTYKKQKSPTFIDTISMISIKKTMV